MEMRNVLVVVWETEPDRDELNVAGANLIDWQDQNASFDDSLPSHLFCSRAGTVTYPNGSPASKSRPISLMCWTCFRISDDVLPTIPPTPRPSSCLTSIGSAHRSARRHADVERPQLYRHRCHASRLQDPFENADLWTRHPIASRLPLVDVGAAPDELRGLHWLRTIARLKRDVTIESAQADLDVIAARLATTYSEDNAQRGVQIVPLHEQITGDVRPALLVLFGAVGFLATDCLRQRRESASRARVGA